MGEGIFKQFPTDLTTIAKAKQSIKLLLSQHPLAALVSLTQRHHSCHRSVCHRSLTSPTNLTRCSLGSNSPEGLKQGLSFNTTREPRLQPKPSDKKPDKSHGLMRGGGQDCVALVDIILSLLTVTDTAEVVNDPESAGDDSSLGQISAHLEVLKM